MDDLYWGLFPGEHDSEEFVPCLLCQESHSQKSHSQKSARLCKVCRQRKQALLKSPLEEVCSVDSDHDDHPYRITRARFKKITVSKRHEPGGDDGERDKPPEHGMAVETDRLVTETDLSDQSSETSDMEDEDADDEDFLRFYFPDPGETDDGVFDPFASSCSEDSAAESVSRHVWETAERAFSILGLVLRQSAQPQYVVRSFYKTGSLKTATAGLGVWRDQGGPAWYYRLWNWMGETD